MTAGNIAADVHMSDGVMECSSSFIPTKKNKSLKTSGNASVATDSYECSQSCCSFKQWKEKNFNDSLGETYCHELIEKCEDNRLRYGDWNTMFMWKPISLPILENSFSPETSGITRSHFYTEPPMENSRRSFNTNLSKGDMDSHFSPLRKFSLKLNDGGHVKTSFKLKDFNSNLSDGLNFCSTFPRVSNNGDTALHRACMAGHDLVVRRLIEESCSIDRQNQLGDSALHVAACHGFSRCVKALIEGRANIGLKNKNSDTAIHLACANSHSGSLRLLLSSYSYCSPKNAQGDTPLHMSVRFGHVTCTRVLISSRCNVNVPNKNGNTALHIATIARHRKLVRILLDAGACPKTQLNNENKSALDIAKDNNDGETAIMLLSGSRPKSASEGRGRSRKKYGKSARSKSETRKELPLVKIPIEKCPTNHPRDTIRRKSASLPRKEYLLRANQQRHDFLKQEGKISCEDILEGQQHSITVNPFVVPQLYSLYRDCEGNVKQRPVIEQLPNPTVEIVSSLANAVSETKGELLQEIKKTNCLLEKKFEELEDNTHMQVTKLDHVIKERINAERTRCLHRIDRRAMMERAVLSNKSCSYCSEDCHKAQHNNADCCHLDRKSCSNVGMPECSIMLPGLENFEDLQPYQTVKVLSENRDVHSSHDSPKMQKITKKYADSFSDSAYSSLCPKLPLKKLPNLSEAQSNFSDIRKNFDPGKVGNFTFEGEQKSILGPKNQNEIFSKVTHQFFENITQAMEDWYERRLQEVTEKQQQEMNKKVSELEKKVKLLEMSSQCSRNDHLDSKLNDIAT